MGHPTFVAGAGAGSLRSQLAPASRLLGMTKFRTVAHLGMGGGGWTESKRGLSSCSYLGSAGLGSTAEFSCRAASRQVSCSEGMDRGFFCRVGCWFVDHVFVDLGVLQSGAG